MNKKFDQLYKYNILKLIFHDKIIPSYYLLGRKYIYKVKKDINGNIAKFMSKVLFVSYINIYI